MAAENGRPVLLLDLGGVIFHDSFPEVVFDEISVEAGVRRSVPHGWYLERRDAFWAGRLSEEDFWAGLLEAVETRHDADYWRGRVVSGMSLLPPAQLLSAWSEDAELWVLSNNRGEWVEPLLSRHGLARYFTRTFISSGSGMVKPAVLADGRMKAILAGRRHLYVDDNRRNIEAAQQDGLCTILADPDGGWCAEVTKWLSGRIADRRSAGPG